MPILERVLSNFVILSVFVVLPIGAIVQGYRCQGWLKASLKLVMPLLLAIPLGLWLESVHIFSVWDVVLLVMLFVVIMGFVTRLDTD